MATIRPFAALRPDPARAGQICELPYDVMSSAEARQMAQGRPLSFLHVSKPEIDLAADIDPYAAEVYGRGRENFTSLISQGALIPDPSPRFYLYRQVQGGHSQTGLVATASCREYRDHVVRRHELTRPDKEDDRVRHIQALDAQTGPVFLVYRAVAELDALVADAVARTPAIDFTAPDGVRHTAWTLDDPAAAERITALFARVPRLYIADGHHRCAAAARVWETRQGRGRSESFLAVIFPHNQTRILPYNRVLKDLNGHSPDQLLARLSEWFEIQAASEPRPGRKHDLGFYLAGRWHRCTFRPQWTAAGDPIDRLDVSLLQRLVLAPVFGIDDPRTSQRIQFVGGIRGTAELERVVDGGQSACAFAMFPTDIDDLLTIADAHGIMPPKSTWFEPKLRDGLFCHRI
jgi:uncharacterized protein (DUF1015 family)